MDSATGDEVAHPGLLIEWRKSESGWSALVTYVVDDDGSAVVVTQWVAATLLTPANIPLG